MKGVEDHVEVVPLDSLPMVIGHFQETAHDYLAGDIASRVEQAEVVYGLGHKRVVAISCGEVGGGDGVDRPRAPVPDP